MSAKELSARIGARVLVELRPGCHAACEVTDAREAYGFVKLRVKPLAGDGQAWINESSVKEPEETGK